MRLQDLIAMGKKEHDNIFFFFFSLALSALSHFCIFWDIWGKTNFHWSQQKNIPLTSVK